MIQTSTLISLGFIIIFSMSLVHIYVTFKMFHLLKKIQESKTSFDKEQKKLELYEEVKTTVLLQMYTIRNAVQKQITNVHVKSIEQAPKTVAISDDLLKESFSAEEILTIEAFWQLFNMYINDYWLTKNGGYKTVFTGQFDFKTGEVGKMVLSSEQLIPKLDLLIKKFT